MRFYFRIDNSEIIERKWRGKSYGSSLFVREEEGEKIDFFQFDFWCIGVVCVRVCNME